ncbi:MAG: hypothetical protein ABL958_02280 [Bdellovibrionia bacterium]
MSYPGRGNLAAVAIPNQFKNSFFFFAAIAILLPAHIQRIDFRQFSQMKPVYVSLKRTSPPVSILEDTFSKQAEPSKTAPIFLRAGRETPHSLNQPPRIHQLAAIVLNGKDDIPAPIQVQPALSAAGQDMIDSIRRGTQSVMPAVAPAPQQPAMEATAPSTISEQQPFIISGGKIISGMPLVAAPKAVSIPLKAPPQIVAPINRPKIDWGKAFSKNVVITGPLEITGGLAFTGGGDYISVYRQVGNTNLEAGKVWIRDGRFEIQVQEPYGNLVAELRRSDGNLIGRGEVWIEDIEGVFHGMPKEARLVIEPSIVSTKGLVQSAYSYEGYSDPIAEADVEVPAIEVETQADDLGVFRMPEAEVGSSFLVKAKKNGFWGGLTLATNVSTYALTMYPDRMIKALYEVVGRPEGIKFGDFESSGIIWGKITHHDQPLAGTKVELADGAAYGPIYFNSLHLPDRRLETTGPNGLFVFVRAQPGINVVRAYNGDKALPSKVVMVDHHHASHVVLEASQKRVADVYVQDLLSKRPLVSNVKFVGSAKGGQTTQDGSIRLRYTFANDPLFIEVDSGENYLPSRVSTHRRARFISVPQVKRDWMNELVKKLPVTPQEGLGTIVGFIENKNFVTYLDRTDNEYIQIFYFNSKGEIIPSGEAGGGFIIVNAKPGPRSVTIGGDRSVVPWTQVTLVDSSKISVITHQF